MAMVRRWAIFRVADDLQQQVGAHPSKGAAATEAMRLASITGMPHHIVEQITSRRQAIEGYARATALQRV
jgi:hypothetical protein